MVNNLKQIYMIEKLWNKIKKKYIHLQIFQKNILSFFKPFKIFPLTIKKPHLKFFFYMQNFLKSWPFFHFLIARPPDPLLWPPRTSSPPCPLPHIRSFILKTSKILINSTVYRKFIINRILWVKIITAIIILKLKAIILILFRLIFRILRITQISSIYKITKISKIKRTSKVT